MKISNSQLDKALAMEWHALERRIERQWPHMSSRLYPDKPPLQADRVANWVAQATSACRQWRIDDEVAVITLATNVLSAATLGLPQGYIADMSRYFLASASDGADHTAAQEWIARALFEQHEDQRTRGIP